MAIQSQNERMFQNLVRNQTDRIYNLALWKTGDITLAEDATQETFLRAWRGLDRFRSEASIETWLYRIALNVCATLLKREGKLDLLDRVVDLEEQPAGNETPVEFVEAMSRREAIQATLRRLPRAQAEAIALYYLREFKVQEVAEIMSQPLNTVKSHLRRGKQRLRVLLKESGI